MANHANFWKSLLFALVLFSFVGLQTASVVVDHHHEHSGSDTHCCPACHAGHLPVLQTAPEVHIAPLAIVEWHGPQALQLLQSASLPALSFSRAPPVQA